MIESGTGKYQIHKRAESGKIDEEDDGICLSKKSCKEADIPKLMEAKLAKCSHCGAKNWNILGDAETGYVVTEGDGALCLVREKGTNRAMTAPCDSQEIPYVPLQLQFASAADIKTMSSPGARMIGAASDGDKKTIQALLKDGVDINVRDWDELTALVPAASAGHLDVCKFLVKEGIDVNAKDKDGITALMEASILGHIKIVEYLLSNGAEVDAKADSDVTALWLAASEGQTEVMKALIDAGADASNTRSDGITALMSAAAGGHEDAVKLLLEHGADPKVADKDGTTPLINAAEKGSVACVRLIAEQVNDPAYLNALSLTDFNALIIASAQGHKEVVEYLLNAGADVDGAAQSKVTALMYAAASNHVEVTKVLLDKGANIEGKHVNGGTALLEAATGGAADTLKLLIEKGAKVDFEDEDGITPLMAIASLGSLEGLNLVIESLKKTMTDEQLKQHINKLSYSGGSSVMFAAAGGHPDCTKALLELGADINAIARATPEYLVKLKKMIEEGTYTEEEPHIDGVTALHVAAQGGHLDTVNLLLKEGAAVTVKDDEGRTALTLAIKGNYGEVATALVKAGADPQTPYVDEEGVTHDLLFDSIMVENEDFAKLLIEKGADIYHKDDKMVSNLLQASHRGFVDIVKMLLERHASSGNSGYIDDISEEGVSPLIAAASEGHPEVAAALLAAGANMNLKDQDGTTPLMAAAARGHLEVVKELLKAGASVNDQNKDGHTALMFAYNGKNQVETLFERYGQYVKESAEKEDVDDSGTGPIIKEALANHVALVDMLLKNGADPSLKDKEGHTAKDFDYHPDADADVLEKQAKAEKVRDESKNEL